jgi:5-hydroxyisourate hydrolase-like protein (transthyretin family)
MSYMFSGRLHARTCGGSLAPVANATLMVYRKSDTEEPGFSVRQHEEIRDREYALIAQSRTDDQGEFRINFAEKTIFGHRGSTHPFSGEPFVLDVCVRAADVTIADHDPETVQFTLGVITPLWEGEERTGRWEYEIPEADWSRVREALDVWTIIGRVVRGGNPAAGLKVFAYDADLVQDDFLGSATTDAEGRFRIDYSGDHFRKTAVPGAGYERGGPELYFRVETADGTVLYKEEKSRGNKPDRADASNCFTAELNIDAVPSEV